MRDDEREPEILDEGGTLSPDSALLEATRIPIRRPPILSRRGLWNIALTSFVLFFLTYSGLGLPFMSETHGWSPVASWAAIAGVLAACVALATLLRALRRPDECPPIVSSRLGLLIPRSWEARFSIMLTWDRLPLVCTRRVWFRERLEIVTNSFRFHCPLSALESPEHVEALQQSVREHLPRGSGEKTLTELRADLRTAIARRRPVTTLLVASLTGAAFGMQLLSDSAGGLGPLLLGANARALVLDGQIDRLVTSTFLSTGAFGALFHIGVLILLGTRLEAILGPRRTAIVFVTSSIAGNALCAWVDEAWWSTSGGGALGGLFGAMVVVNWRFWMLLPPQAIWTRPTVFLTCILGVLLIEATGALLLSETLTGLIFGMVTTSALLQGHRGLLDVVGAAQCPPALRHVCAAMTVVVVAALVTSGTRAAISDEETRVELLATLCEGGSENHLDAAAASAWRLAFDRDSTATDRDAALTIARTLTTLETSSGSYRHLLASAARRAGRLDEAIEAARAAVRLRGDIATWSLLAELLEDRLGEREPLAMRMTLQVSDDGKARLSIGGDGRARADGSDGPTNVYAILRRGEELIGALRVRVDEIGESPREVELGETRCGWLGAGVEVVPVLEAPAEARGFGAGLEAEMSRYLIGAGRSP